MTVAEECLITEKAPFPRRRSTPEKALGACCVFSEEFGMSDVEDCWGCLTVADAGRRDGQVV
jgi:hypothetical protein